jgi:hypothetical protein
MQNIRRRRGITSPERHTGLEGYSLFKSCSRGRKAVDAFANRVHALTRAATELLSRRIFNRVSRVPTFSVTAAVRWWPSARRLHALTRAATELLWKGRVGMKEKKIGEANQAYQADGIRLGGDFLRAQAAAESSKLGNEKIDKGPVVMEPSSHKTAEGGSSAETAKLALLKKISPWPSATCERGEKPPILVVTVHRLASCRCAEPPRPGQQVARATQRIPGASVRYKLKCSEQPPTAAQDMSSGSSFSTARLWRISCGL